MTDDYTPTTEEVREYYGMGWFAEDDDLVQGDPIRNFDRWYAVESARLRAEGAAEALQALIDNDADWTAKAWRPEEAETVVKMRKAIKRRLEAARQSVAPAPECSCFVTDEKYWTTHYGAVEPGSTMEPNLECPVHFPASVTPVPEEGNHG